MIGGYLGAPDESIKALNTGLKKLTTRHSSHARPRQEHAAMLRPPAQRPAAQ